MMVVVAAAAAAADDDDDDDDDDVIKTLSEHLNNLVKQSLAQKQKVDFSWESMRPSSSKYFSLSVFPPRSTWWWALT